MTKPLLTADDRRRIEQAIAELEQESALELVVTVVPRSSSYAGWRALGAGIWAIAGGLLGASLLPQSATVWVILGQAPLALVAYLLLGNGMFGRWLISDRDLDRAVTARAYQLFAECGIHDTRAGTGVLLLLSEFEHRAVLLGDKAVHRVVGDTGWERETARLVAQIRAGRSAEGVLEVLRDLASALGPEFPRAGDDVNELPDSVQRRD